MVGISSHGLLATLRFFFALGDSPVSAARLHNETNSCLHAHNVTLYGCGMCSRCDIGSPGDFDHAYRHYTGKESRIASSSASRSR